MNDSSRDLLAGLNTELAVGPVGTDTSLEACEDGDPVCGICCSGLVTGRVEKGPCTPLTGGVV